MFVFAFLIRVFPKKILSEQIVEEYDMNDEKNDTKNETAIIEEKENAELKGCWIKVP